MDRLAHARQHFPARHARHLNVEHHQREIGAAVEPFESCRAVLGLRYPKAVLFEHGAGDSPRHRIVIDEQQVGSRRRVRQVVGPHPRLAAAIAPDRTHDRLHPVWGREWRLLGRCRSDDQLATMRADAPRQPLRDRTAQRRRDFPPVDAEIREPRDRADGIVRV